MTDQALDDLARRAMLDAARQEYGNLTEDLPEHDFSPEFERKMRKLACRADHPLWHRVARAAACLFLAALFSGCAVLAVSAEARETLTGWVREVYETSFVYRFFGAEQVSSDHVLYRPAWVPAGYRAEEEFVSKDVLSIEYRGGAGELTVFTCFMNGASPVIQVVRDGTETYRQVSVNGMPAELYIDLDEGEANVLIWTDETKGAIFLLHSPLSGTELIKMAESVEAVPATWRPVWLPEGYEDFDESSGLAAHNSYMSDGRLISLVVGVARFSKKEKRVRCSKPYPQSFFLNNLQLVEGKFHAFQDQFIPCASSLAAYAVQPFHQFNRHSAGNDSIFSICLFWPNNKSVLCHNNHPCKLIKIL